jgi:hypothetical protein
LCLARTVLLRYNLLSLDLYFLKRCRVTCWLFYLVEGLAGSVWPARLNKNSLQIRESIFCLFPFFIFKTKKTLFVKHFAKQYIDAIMGPIMDSLYWAIFYRKCQVLIIK